MNAARSKSRTEYFLLGVQICLGLAFLIRVGGLLRDASQGYGLLHSDDAYYYLLAARNFIDLGFFTTDGLNPTNGFHPLWAAVLTGYFGAFGTTGSLASQIFGVSLVEGVFRTVAFCGCLLAASRAERPIAAGFWGIALLLAFPWIHLFEMGMETTLALLFLSSSLYMLLNGRQWLFGLSLAGLVLSRLDTLVFVLPWLLLAAALLWSFRRALQVAVLPGLAFVAYCAINLAFMGHAKPISGALKSSFPMPHPSLLQWHEQWQMLEWNGLLHMLVQPNMLLVLVLLVLGVAAAAWSRPSRETTVVLGSLAAAALSLLTNFLLFQKWSKSVEVWYYGVPLACALFVFAAGVSLASSRARIGVFPVVVALLSALCLWRAWADFPPQRTEPFKGLPAFQPIVAATRPDDILASTDSGALSFWTGRRVINLDGLVNNYAYQSRIANGELGAYLREQGVKYIALAHWTQPGQLTNQQEKMYAHRLFPAGAQSADYEKYEFWVHSYLFNKASERLVFRPCDEAARVHLGQHGGAQASFVLYRFPPACG